MSTFVSMLNIELGSLDESELFEPEQEKTTRDHVVGEMSLPLVKLFTLWRLTDKDLDERAMKLKWQSKCDSGSMEDFLQEARKLKSRSEVLETIFWHALREEFNLWDKDVIGVRKGRLVVWSKARKPSFGFPFMFGTGGDEE